MAKNKKKEEIKPFHGKLDDYYKHLDGLKKSIKLSMSFALYYYKKEQKEINDFIDKNGKDVKKYKNSKVTFHLSFDDQVEYEQMIEEQGKTEIAMKMVPRSLFVSMISQFDLLIADLMREILVRHPRVISKEKSLNYEQILALSSLDEAKMYFIEDEVDTVLRGSHSGQIEWFEKKAHINLKEMLGTEWSSFIEITERRNLFVHNEGVVNSQYLTSCKKHKIVLSDDLKIGTQLAVESDYLEHTYKVLYSVITKLSWTVWRKLRVATNDDLDSYFSNHAAKLIKEGELSLAENILTFFFYQAIDSEDLNKTLYLINLALALRLQGKKKECCVLVDDKDWSSSSVELKMAMFLLKDKFEEVYALMSDVPAKSLLIRKDAYKHDPIFSDLRKKEKFKEIYKKIYNEDYFDNEIRSAK